MRHVLPLLLALGLASPAAAADQGSVHPRETVRDAVLAPLEDLNLKETPIPEVLSRARSDPYALTGLDRCEPIAAEIGRLDAALGPDLDEAPPPDTRSRAAKIADEVKGAGLAEVRDKTRSVLPFRGWVRKLSGAAAHDRKVKAAIRAGEIRRGFLKGTGMRMNCAPPAAPSWFVPAKPAAPPSLWDRFVTWIRSWWPFQARAG
ncbi:MAG: hypothetical protein CFE28_01070 [Alphaproteobacteria bacterium PA2]|nr:MAG: hypothetical protein CFE28_01070 [Alphaproteobacteria bacterium PA2]